MIELIVAIGIIGFILPAVFNIFFSMIRQQLILISYQDIKQQGDSVKKNIRFLLQNRVSDVTDSTYTAIDVCPLPLTPTPTYSPEIFLRDRDGNFIHLYITPIPVPTNSHTIASSSATAAFPFVATKVYNLTSKDVTVSTSSLGGFSCYRINEFDPPIVSTRYTIEKTALFKNISLPYSFNTRLRDY